MLPGVNKVTEHVEDGQTSLELVLAEEGVIGSVINTLEASHGRLLKLTKREPTLEDVFVDLVGRSMEQVEGETEDGD